jgi:glycosyltransferase involved in cell wall biosynthesis
MNKEISLVISVFNKSSVISETLDSISRFAHNYDEIIFVDDCSTDDSLNKLRNFAEAFGNIKVISLEKNSGPFLARIDGIRRCKTDFVQLLDADDILLKVPVIHLEYLKYSLIFYSDKINSKKVFSNHCQLMGGWPHPSSIVVNKRHAIRAVEFSRLSWGEDHVLFSQLLSFANFLFVPGSLGKYVKRAGTRGNRNATLRERYLCAMSIIIWRPNLNICSVILSFLFLARSIVAYIIKSVKHS